MTGYIVWGGILLFFFLLLVSPVYLSVRLGSETENRVLVGYLFIRYSLYPVKRKKGKMKQQTVEKAKKDPNESGQQKERAKASVSDIISLITDFAKASKSPLFHLLRRTYLVHLDLRVEIGGEDAADIALNTAKCRAAVGCFIGMFRNLRLLKRLRHAAVNPNFLREETAYRVQFCIMIRLSTILYAALTAAGRFLIARIKGASDGITPRKAEESVKEAGKSAS